jgi:hypothetical protein
MPGQSGLNEINAGNTAINDGKACDQSPQLRERQEGGFIHSSKVQILMPWLD